MKCEHCGGELIPIDIDIDGYYIKAWICNCNSDYDTLNLTDDRVIEDVYKRQILKYLHHPQPLTNILILPYLN